MTTLLSVTVMVVENYLTNGNVKKIGMDFFCSDCWKKRQKQDSGPLMCSRNHLSISAEVAEITIRTLNEKIEQLEESIEHQKARHEKEMPRYARDVIRSLRLHGFILLNVNDDSIDQILKNTDDQARKECIEESFDINNAPLTTAEIDSFKRACNYGNDRF